MFFCSVWPVGFFDPLSGLIFREVSGTDITGQSNEQTDLFFLFCLFVVCVLRGVWGHGGPEHVSGRSEAI